jgi:hypothetical protein
LHPEDLESGEHEDDGANEGLESGIAKATHERPAESDADARGGKHSPDGIPSGVLAKSRNGANVANQEHGKDDTCGIPCAEEESEYEHVKHADAGEARFADANPHRAECSEEPLGGREVGHF